MQHALTPLLQCANLEPRRIARMDALAEIVPDQTILGRSYPNQNVIGIADGYDTDAIGFTALMFHELAHSILQDFDPTTCTVYDEGRLANPLLKRWLAFVAHEPITKVRNRAHFAAQRETTIARQNEARDVSALVNTVGQTMLLLYGLMLWRRRLTTT